MRVPPSVPSVALLVLGALLSACGEKPAAAPGAPGGPGAAPPEVEWDPEDLKPSPGEFVALPGTGKTWISGVVVDGDGRPVPGAAVEMHAIPRGNSSAVPLLHASAKAGPDGSFRVGPGPSPWWSHGVLSARAPGLARTSLRSRRMVVAGEEFADEGEKARIVLRPGHEVRGEVRARDGGPPDGPVAIWAVGPPNFFEVATADPAGAFGFLSPPGEVRCHAMEGVHSSAVGVVGVAAGAENRVRIEVTRGRDIPGRVVDRETGNPVAGAAIRAYYGETRIFRAGPDGRFLLPRYWYRGFQVRAPGYTARTHHLTSDAGSPEVGDETVRLAPGFVARGRVLDPEGTPLAGVRLRSFSRTPERQWVATPGPVSKSDGSFTFVGLPLPGRGSWEEVRIFGAGEDYADGASPALRGVPRSVEDGVEVRLPRLVGIEGRVEDEEGSPFEATVAVEWDLPRDLDPYKEVLPTGVRVRAGADGRWGARVPERAAFRIAATGDAFGEAGGLPEGLYDVSVVVAPEFLQEVVREARAGGPAVVARMRRPGGLLLRAVLPPGVPPGTVPEVSLRALEGTRALQPVHLARLDPGDPRLELRPLAPGAYALSVAAGDWRIDLERVVVKEGAPTDLGDLDLGPGIAVAGTVVVAGRSGEGAAVEVFRLLPGGRAESVRRGLTGPGGSLRLGGLLPGSHLLTVRPMDRPMIEVRFEAVAGKDAAVDVAVPAGGRLRVKVLDSGGNAVAGARAILSGPGGGIHFWKEGSPRPGPHATEKDGTLWCSGVPAGEIRVNVEKSGVGAGEASVSVADGGEAMVDVVLRGPSR